MRPGDRLVLVSKVRKLHRRQVICAVQGFVGSTIVFHGDVLGTPMTRPVALVLRALGLGDFMTGLPALQLIRRSLPDHRLVLAAGPQFEVLLPLISYLDELYPSGELMRLTGN